MSALAGSYDEFLTRLLPVQLTARLHAAGRPDPRRVVNIPAVILLADVSNFTTVAERFARRLGADGADRLSQTLSECFTKMIDAVHDAGGEVLSISGDAVVGAWYGVASDAKLELVSLQAALACAHLMHRDFVRSHAIEGEPLKLHIGLAAGSLIAAAVGGVDKRFQIASGGTVMKEAFIASTLAASGATVISPAFVRSFGQMLPGNRLADHYLALTPTYVPPSVEHRHQPQDGPPASVLRYFVSTVLAGLEHPDLSHWMSQMRLVTALFCRLASLDHETADQLGELHLAIRAVQTAIGARGGTLDRVQLDEKGVVIIVFFGLPNSPVPGHARLAVEAAISLAASLRALGHASAMGIATGKCFCGLVGSPRRLHYTAHGSVPNLAARFMARAEEQIACDFETERTTRELYDYRPWHVTGLKGIEALLPAYLLVGRRPADAQARTTASTLVGRTDEMNIIGEALASTRQGASQLVLIEGEGGVGKSRLVREAMEHARALDLDTLIGHADAAVSGQPYRIWQDVFEQILDLDPAVEQQARERAWSVALGDEQRLLPLLNPVTRLEVAETEETTLLSPLARGAKIASLLLAILRRATSQQATLIVLEDAHWIDTASWSLACETVRTLPGVSVLATARPSSPSPLHEAATAGIPVLHVPLCNLSREPALALVCSILGIETLPERTAAWLYERSHGNPFFTEELARSLRERVPLADGHEAALPEGVELDSLPLPYNVENALTGRIDHLPLQAQIALKCAAVVGSRFALDALSEILPPEVRLRQVDACMETLAAAQMLTLPGDLNGPYYNFRHQTICRVAYGMLPETQRKRMHEALAGWYSGIHAHAGADWNLIAFHWDRAGRAEHAIASFERASEQALRAGGHREAANCLERILQLAAESAQRDRVREASWHEQLGRCYIALGRLAEGAAQARTALERLAQPLPQKRSTWTMFLAAQIVRHFWLRTRARTRRIRNVDPSPRVQVATRAVNVFAEASYFSADVVALTASNLFAVNLAEAAGEAGSAAKASALIGYLLGVSRMHRVARGFFERPRQACANAGDWAGQQWTLGGQAMYNVSFGRWDAADRAITQALQLCRDAGNPPDTELPLTLAGLAAHYRGRFEESHQHFSELFESASPRSSRQHMAWGAYAMAQNLIPIGRAGEALPLLAQAGELLKNVEDRHSKMIWRGLMALACLHLRDYAGAREAVLAAAQQAAQLPPNNFGSLAGYGNPPAVLIALWGRALKLSPHEADYLETAAEAALRSLARFARVFPIGAPRLLLTRGWMCWYRNDFGRARSLWLRCIERASAFDTRYEHGLAHWALRTASRSDIERFDHERRARELLAAMKAVPLPFDTDQTMVM